MAFPEWFHDLARQVRNWGRWGEDDQIGTLNLVTPDVVRAAAATARTGRTFSLALPMSQAEGIQIGAVPGRIDPLRTMVAINASLTGDPSDFCSSDDVVVMALQAATHWDGLAHVSYDGVLYNGYPAASITAAGAAKLGIHNIRTLVSRGVLLDVARAKGVDRLDGGYAITPEDLGAAEELAKVAVGAGDVVLVRTGQIQLLPDKFAYAAPTAGLGAQAAVWFRERDVAALAIDTMVLDVWPPEDMSALLPVHVLHIVEMGLTQGQNWVLEDLAADCADDGVYEFLLEASPQPFTNAVGSPVNPVAVK
jgi:kynurenine formamidase